MKNKGFTLVELLAVIAILGIVMMIAVIAVLPMINKSGEKTLFNEGKSLVRAAQMAYNENENMRGRNVCISLEWLNKKGYYDKKYDSVNKYRGSVYISENAVKKFIISNSNYVYGYSTTNYNLNAMIDFDSDFVDAKQYSTIPYDSYEALSFCNGNPNNFNTTTDYEGTISSVDDGDTNNVHYYHAKYNS